MARDPLRYSPSRPFNAVMTRTTTEPRLLETHRKSKRRASERGPLAGLLGAALGLWQTGRPRDGTQTRQGFQKRRDSRDRTQTQGTKGKREREKRDRAGTKGGTGPGRGGKGSHRSPRGKSLAQGDGTNHGTNQTRQSTFHAVFCRVCGTGPHSLRIQWGNPWGFKSPLSHSLIL